MCQNEYKIKYTQSFASQIKVQPVLDEDEYVSCHVDSLFTNISAQEKMDYIICQITQKTSFTNLQYKRYVDDIYSHQKKNCTDQLYHELNNYHPNINLTIKINPEKVS